MRYTILVLAFVLTGCLASKTVQQTCAEYGFQPRTVNFARCIQLETLESDRAAQVWHQGLVRQLERNRQRRQDNILKLPALRTPTTCIRSGFTTICN